MRKVLMGKAQGRAEHQGIIRIRRWVENLVRLRSDPSLSCQAQERWEEFSHLSLGLQVPGGLDCPGDCRP